ncbi:MAG: hypothetical protein V4612_07015 [Pseudomonadota bacterium]
MIFADPKFWLSISFLIFLALVIKFVLPKIILALDSKSKQIADQIIAAKQMKEKAEQLLLAAKKHHEESLAYCQKLIEDAKAEAAKLVADSQKSLGEELAKKTDLAKERIALEEEKTIREIKSGIISAAIKIIATKAANLSGNSAADLSKKAIDDISKMVH